MTAVPTPPGPTSDGCLIGARLSRFSAAGGTAGAEQVLIEDWCQQYPSHSIGDVRFGPDGALYLTGGDGASFTVHRLRAGWLTRESLRRPAWRCRGLDDLAVRAWWRPAQPECPPAGR